MNEPTLYAFKGAGAALVLTRDAKGNDHVATIFHRVNDGAIVHINGVAYKVHLTHKDW